MTKHILRRGEKGYWLNTEKILAPRTRHPCNKLNYCPYGTLVEEFPLHTSAVEYAKKKDWYSRLTDKGWVRCDKDDKGATPDLNRACMVVKYNISCNVFGHDCPVHYHREDVKE